VKKFVSVSCDELVTISGRGGGSRPEAPDRASPKSSTNSSYSKPASAGLSSHDKTMENRSLYRSATERVNSSVASNLNQPYRNDCDSWTKRVLDQAGLKVAGFTDPDHQTCAQQYETIKNANPNYLDDPSRIPSGATCLAVNQGHMYIVTKQANGSYTTGNMGGSAKASTQKSWADAKTVKEVYGDSIFVPLK